MKLALLLRRILPSLLLLQLYSSPGNAQDRIPVEPPPEARPSAQTVDDSQDPEDPLMPDKQAAPPLSAKLTIEELSGTASIGKGEHTLKITVVNSGKRALLLDGDNISFGSGNQNALAKEDIIHPPMKNTLPGDVLEVGSSIGTGGTMPVAVDIINKAKNPGPAFYGRDESRRDLAEIRFGKRLVFPGETSSGEIYFRDSATAQTSLSIPVFSHPDGADLGKLNLTVGITDSKPEVKAAKPEHIRTTEAQRLPSELERSLQKRQHSELKQIKKQEPPVN